MDPIQRYKMDPAFRKLVDLMAGMIHEQQFTRFDLANALMLAALTPAKIGDSLPSWDDICPQCGVSYAHVICPHLPLVDREM